MKSSPLVLKCQATQQRLELSKSVPTVHVRALGAVGKTVLIISDTTVVPIDCIGKIFRNLPENQVVPKAALKFPAGIARTGASRHTYGNHLSFLPYEIVEVLHTGVFNKDITGTFEPLMFGGQGVQTPVSPLLFRFGLDERPFLRLGTPVASVGSGAIPLSSFSI